MCNSGSAPRAVSSGSPARPIPRRSRRARLRQGRAPPCRIVSTPSRRRSLRFALLVSLSILTGCVGGAWNRAVDEDTPAAYYRFLRDHAESKHAAEARERLEYHRLLANPSIAGFEAYRKRYPGSALLADLKPALEGPAFELARARGTSGAYREFLTEFPSGKLSARASRKRDLPRREGLPR